MHIYQTTPARRSRFLWLRRLFMAALLLLGICSAVFLLFFRGYVVETAEGPVLRLPFFAEDVTVPAFSGEAVTVYKPGSGAPSPLQAVLLPLEAVEDGTAADLMRAAGGNALILDMKDVSGQLRYVSALPEAIAARTSAADPARNDMLSAFNRALGTYTIARVACFPDGAMAENYPDMALPRASGSPWREEDGQPWLSPASAAAQGYVLALCRELHALGFDEVLLTGCAYPTGGRQELLAASVPRGAIARAAALADFYARLQQLSAETGLHISILLEGGEASGQRLADLVPFAAHVCLSLADSKALEEAAQGDPAARLEALVPVLSAPGEEGAAWAVF